MVFPIDLKFERIIQQTFVALLQPKGYQRHENQFYHKTGRVGRLIRIFRISPDGYHPNVILFTINVLIISDDFWELNYPDQTIPAFPFTEIPVWKYSIIDRHLGLFYGKDRRTTYVSVDLVMLEANTVDYLRTLLATKIIPYVEKFNSIDDILAEPHRARSFPQKMTMLAWLGRRDEARLELKKLIASRHHKGFRMGMVALAKRYNII